MKRSLIVFLLAFLVVLAGCRDQAGYPQRPIVLICPWSAGGGTDRISRQIASQLERELGVPVNVVNATGGAGVTGHTRGAVARPDGYTITLITAELNMLHWRGLTNITHWDFQPLALVNRDSAALFVRQDAEWETVTQLTDAIRQEPGQWKASGTAFGGIWHVALAGWLTQSGLGAQDLIWVSINGSAPSLQELLAGGVDVVCCSVAEAQSLLDAGRVRCLAVMADERSASLRDVATLKECDVDWSLATWRGLAAPRGVPTQRLKTLAAAIQRVVASDEYVTFMDRAGFGVDYAPADDFAAQLGQLDEQFGAIFKSPAFASVHEQRFGPLLFPSLLGVLAGVVLCALGVSGGLRLPADAKPLTSAGLCRTLLVPGWVVVYLLLADSVGFVVLATVLTCLMMWLLRVRPVVGVAVSVILIPAVYQLFAVYLRVPFPWGWLGW